MEDISLRPVRGADLPAITGEDSPYDAFGPLTRIPHSVLEGPGGMVIASAADPAVPLGLVTWHWIHWGPTRGSACPRIGIWVAPSARGRGIGAAAQRKLAELFFDNTPTRRVEAGTDVDNVVEQRSLERAGFGFEGVVRRAQWRDGAYHDLRLYSMLREDENEDRR